MTARDNLRTKRRRAARQRRWEAKWRARFVWIDLSAARYPDVIGVVCDPPKRTRHSRVVFIPDAPC